MELCYIHCDDPLNIISYILVWTHVSNMGKNFIIFEGENIVMSWVLIKVQH